jgi:hypothetical protein
MVSFTTRQMLAQGAIRRKAMLLGSEPIREQTFTIGLDERACPGNDGLVSTIEEDFVEAGILLCLRMRIAQSNRSEGFYGSDWIRAETRQLADGRGGQTSDFRRWLSGKVISSFKMS